MREAVYIEMRETVLLGRFAKSIGSQPGLGF
jgi:hypothetical protein